MAEEKASRVTPVAAYQTSDGRVFLSADEADEHQGLLDSSTAFYEALDLVDYYPREAPSQQDLADALAKKFIITPRNP